MTDPYGHILGFLDWTELIKDIKKATGQLQA
jgi:hypothetical protein